MPLLRRFVGVLGVVLATLLTPTAATSATPSGAVLYVVTPGHLTLYQEGTWNQVGTDTLPFSDNVRGSAVDLGRDSLYISHGGHGGTSGNGSLLRYDLASGNVVWNKSFSHGADMPAVCGGKVYLPSGSGTSNSTWYILDADTGAQVGTLSGGSHPHNTICHNGVVYMGGENSAYLYATGRPKAGPVSPLGIRPFTVNAADTRAWVTQSNYRGFSVLNTVSGARLATVKFGANPSNSPLDAYSHGVSLSPDGSEVYVLDTVAQSVRVYSSADSPQIRSTIKLKTPISGQDTPCSKSCTREGWLLHSLDGRYVYVGDSGDVINTTTRTVVTHLAALQNDRHGYVEVDWSNGQPVATTTHFGTGH